MNELDKNIIFELEKYIKYIDAQRQFLDKDEKEKNEDNPIKVFCEKPQFKVLCNLRDYIIMLALSLVGLLIIYVFIKIIDSKTKYHLIKSVNYTRYR